MPGCQLRAVPAYRHIGTQVAGNGSMRVEINARRGAAVRERRSLQGYFRNSGAPAASKIMLVRQVGVSMLTANAGTWPALTAALARTLQTELEEWIRAAVGMRRGPQDHVAFRRIQAGVEDIGDTVRGLRLRYFRRTVLCAPAAVWALLQQTTPLRPGEGRQGNWAGALREDLCWLRGHSRKLDSLPGHDGFAFGPWLNLIRAAPGVWNG